MRLIISSLLAMSLSYTAQADKPRDPVSTEFSFSRADLVSQTSAGRVLEALIDEVSETCRELRPESWVKGPVDADCVSEMVENAVAEINAPNLSAAYDQRLAVEHRANQS